VLTCAKGGDTAISNAAFLTVRATGTVTTLPPIIGNFGWAGCEGSTCTLWWTGMNGPINATMLTLTPMGGTPLDVTGLTQVMVSPKTSTLYTLTASNSAGTYTRNVFVPVGDYTATINSCGAITAPGRYLVTSSVTSTSMTSPCLDVRDTGSVFIDCASGVTISGFGGLATTPSEFLTSGAINFTNVNGFAVRGCNAVMSEWSPPFATFIASFTNSSMGYVFNSTFGDPTLNRLQGLQTYQSNYITFTSDKIYNSIDIHDNSTGLAFMSTAIMNTNTSAAYTAANILEPPGGAFGTQVVSCILDGGATAPGIGADDGIDGEGSNELYAYNLMRNYWDMAIEGSSPAYSYTIYQNNIQNVGVAAIDFFSSLVDSIISWNYIDISSPLLWASGNATPGIHIGTTRSSTLLHFLNNNFNNNFIVNGPHSGASQFFTPVDAEAANNVFYNNNFNYNNYPGIGAPVFTIRPGIATDWGGNLCEHSNPPPGYPLVCH
jgi:hypothetical protein